MLGSMFMYCMWNFMFLVLIGLYNEVGADSNTHLVSRHHFFHGGHDLGRFCCRCTARRVHPVGLHLHMTASASSAPGHSALYRRGRYEVLVTCRTALGHQNCRFQWRSRHLQACSARAVQVEVDVVRHSCSCGGSGVSEAYLLSCFTHVVISIVIISNISTSIKASTGIDCCLAHHSMN